MQNHDFYLIFKTTKPIVKLCQNFFCKKFQAMSMHVLQSPKNKNAELTYKKKENHAEIIF